MKRELENRRVGKNSEQPWPSLVSGSGCYHSGLEQAVEEHRLPFVSANVANEHLFGLIIGINNYQDENIRKLEGCVRDSENVCRFLTESLHANPLHIRHLRDSEATRKGILSAFKEHLINNQDIQQNDAIVFYFAGHGSYEIPEENYFPGNKMEAICPYDDRKGARGIPDRTFASLMRHLAVLKGNNITAIFDSCHSGGMGRMSLSDSQNSRFLTPPDSPFPRGLDEDLWNSDPNPRMENDDPYLPYPPLRSHVLLAACQHDEPAYESPMRRNGHVGAFTSLLLDLLRQPGRNLTETTYVGLFHALQQQEYKSRLRNQTPYVEGDNKTRVLFSMKDLGRQLLVSLNDNGTFSVAAGTIHGIDNETEFAITSGRERFRSLKPSQVFPLSCSFSKIDNVNLRNDSRAEVTKWNRPHLKVFFQQTHGNGPSDSQDYDVIISRFPNESMKLERRDGLIPRYAEKVIPFTSYDASVNHSTPITQTSVIIDPITRFNFHLLRQSTSNIVGKKLRVKLEHLSRLHGEPGSSCSYFPARNGEDFFTSGESLAPRAYMKKGPKVTAAVKIPDVNHHFSFTLSIHDFPTPLFPYVFGFDPSTYEIAVFYHPESTKEGPLHVNRVVTIGYGAEGGDPIEFQPNEVTFFKIFVTSKYVDLKGLVQTPPFSGGSARIPKRWSSAISDDFWESWIYVVRS